MSYPPASNPRGGQAGIIEPLISYGVPALIDLATTGFDYFAKKGEKAREAEQKEAQLRLEAELEKQHMQHELELQQEAAREQLELEEARREAIFQEREREISAAEQRLASLPRSEASTTQSLQQAAAYLRLLKSRYPNIFALRPELGPYVEGQILGALLAPADPTDPLYVQKVVGELEFQLARSQQQIAPSLDYTPPEQLSPGQKKYPEAPSWSKPSKPKKKKGKGHTTALLGCEAAPPKPHTMFGGGVSAVLDP